jgi:hypothetical protein
MMEMDSIERDLFGALKIGTDIEEAAVTKLNKWGAYFSLDAGLQGFARVRIDFLNNHYFVGIMFN